MPKSDRLRDCGRAGGSDKSGVVSILTLIRTLHFLNLLFARFPKKLAFDGVVWIGCWCHLVHGPQPSHFHCLGLRFAPPVFRGALWPADCPRLVGFDGRSLFFPLFHRFPTNSGPPVPFVFCFNLSKPPTFLSFRLLRLYSRWSHSRWSFRPS